MSNFHTEVVKYFLSDFVPKVIERGGNHADILGILENLVVGVLFVTKETFHVDPNQAFETLKKHVDQRLADMESEATVKRILHG